MNGAKFVLPGPHVDAESLLELIGEEGVTIACGVPTVWIGVLEELEKHPEKWKLMARTACDRGRHGSS